MRTFVPDRTCWSLLLTALAIRLRYKPTYDKLRVLIINKDVRKLLTRKYGNENPIWSWNDSSIEINIKPFMNTFRLIEVYYLKGFGCILNYITNMINEDALVLLLCVFPNSNHNYHSKLLQLSSKFQNKIDPNPDKHTR